MKFSSKGPDSGFDRVGHETSVTASQVYHGGMKAAIRSVWTKKGAMSQKYSLYKNGQQAGSFPIPSLKFASPWF